MDFFASHDFEDIIAVLDGRTEVVEEVSQADDELKKYLLDSFASIYKNRFFHDALPGHFAQYVGLAEERIEYFLKRLRDLLSINMDAMV